MILSRQPSKSDTSKRDPGPPPAGLLPDDIDPKAVSVMFAHSLLPMLIADNRRRYIDANRAACLILRLSREQVFKLKIDDLTPPEHRYLMSHLWDDFIRAGTQGGTYEILMPDGQRITLLYSATANFRPGQHISILDLSPSSEHAMQRVLGQTEEGRLSRREREVLALVAMGETSQAIAATLHLSAATVETHVRHAINKLRARNRPHAIALALASGELALV
jgi:DNA-binding CsgD family transcriptional regulator